MKAKKLTRLLTALLALVLLAAILVGCGETPAEKPKEEGGEKEPQTDPEKKEDEEEEEEEGPDPYYVNDLPENLNFEEKELNFLQRTGYKTEFNSAAKNGELLNDTVYNRNLRLCAKLNVKMQFQDVQGTNTTFATYANAIRNSNASGAIDTYDIVANYAYFCPSLILDNNFQNLHELNVAKDNYLNFDKVFWNQSFQNEAEIDGKLYFMVGDACSQAITRLSVCYVNEDLAANYFPDVDFLEVVYDGDWTYEYFLDKCRQVGNGETNGKWGATLIRNSFAVDGMLGAMAVNIVSRNDVGGVEIDFNNERTINLTTALRSIFQNEEESIYAKEDSTPFSTFYGGNSVFYVDLMNKAQDDHLQNSTFGYAIIPQPKWNDNQEDYRVAAHDEYSSLSILTCCVDTDAASALLQEMNAESYEELRPALYNKCYKKRYLGTERKAQMFDFVLDHAYFEFGYIYSNVMSNPVHTLRDSIRYADTQTTVYSSITTRVSNAATVSASTLRKFVSDVYAM